MKLYKTTYDIAKPSNNTINVPTDTEAYAVGVKIQKNGETVTHDVDELKLGTLSTDTYFDDYAVFTLSAGSDTASEDYNISSINTDLVFEQQVTATGGKTVFGMTQTIFVTLSAELAPYVGARITVDDSHLELYRNGELVGTTYQVQIHTDNSDIRRGTVILNNFDTTGGSFPNGKGIYYLNNESHKWEFQPNMKSIVIDEHMTYCQLGTFFDGDTKYPAGTIVKGVGQLGKIKIGGNFKLQVTHTDTGEGQLADQPVFNQFLTLSGTDGEQKAFSYTLPIQE